MRSAHPPRILVVDDEPGTVEVLSMVLTDAGYRATGASDGAEALASMAVDPPDVVLLDLVMPSMDGSRVHHAMTRDVRLARVPVVLMSGVDEGHARRRCPGAAHVLRKPFSLDVLLAVVRRAAARPGRSPR